MTWTLACPESWHGRRGDEKDGDAHLRGRCACLLERPGIIPVELMRRAAKSGGVSTRDVVV
jgi:hypothetical protein